MILDFLSANSKKIFAIFNKTKLLKKYFNQIISLLKFIKKSFLVWIRQSRVGTS